MLIVWLGNRCLFKILCLSPFLFSTSFQGKDDGGSCARVPILVNGIALPPCTVYIGHHRLPHNQKVTGQKTCRNRNKKYIVTMNRQIAKRSQAKKHVNTGITNTLLR